jgi:cytochrome-b5 reductase
MGTALHTLQPGETVDVKGPNQQVKIEAGKYMQYGFVAGGTGITPIIQAIRHVLTNDTAKVSLITLNKTTGDILLRNDLNQLQKEHAGRLEVTHVVEYGDITEGVVAVHGDGPFQWSTTSMMKGRVSKEILAALPSPGDGVMIMVCGRPPMTAAIAGKKNKDFTQGAVGGMLKKLGYGTDQVWKI